MHYKIKSIVLLGLLSLAFSACSNESEPAGNQAGPNEDATAASGNHEAAEAHEEGTVRMSPLQLEAVGLKLGTLQNRNLSTAIKVTGELEVPPQSEANVSAIVGGNVQSIKVVEGDKVRKGQTLAVLSHPDLVQMQVDLQEAAGRLQYLEQEYQRQQRLYEQKVGSGRALQEATSNFTATKAQVAGLKSQLDILGLNTKSVLSGKIYQSVPVVSPISGYVKKVNVTTGGYVSPQEQMFAIVDNSQLHADFMVFEKDIAKVKEGQKVRFTVANAGNQSYTATIYAVGKAFEEEPKAVHVHADIDGKTDNLIPGMYIEGRLAVDEVTTLALPEEAVVQDGDQAFIFVKTGEADAGEEHAAETTAAAGEKAAPEPAQASGKSWVFKQVPVITGASDNGWVEIKLSQPLPDSAQVAYNGAYNLLSEMGKGETEHAD
ncbi:efflux RND transporter periplasmic adaptor subunit [Pontibacter sp. 172403-2]|nr:efflux RND transporter periplasmic adaptor subunit [Pontibacter sp. 172403-2]